MAAGKGREMKASAEFVACVVGLSRGDGEAFSSYSGVGKSCLCYRFVYPGFDDYVDNHQSILALHEFESLAINRDHFLYWGSVFKHFPVKGSKSGSQYAIIQVHVIEHTVFYQDETSQPFPNFDSYRKRIIRSLESPGKVSYKSRDELEVSSDTQQYPSKKLSKLPKGYMVVLDVSQIGTAFDAQLQRVEQILEYLTKHKQKFIIVASKRDDSNPNSLRCAQDLKKKYHAILVETSASGNINIRDAFRLLAHKVLKKSDISDSVKSFVDAQQNALKTRSYAKRAFQEFLEEQVVDPKEQLHGLYESSEFRECKKLTGNFDTGWLFATHILQLFNEEYSSKEDNQGVTRQEYLENVIKERPDLSTYSHHLKSWIEFYTGEDQADASVSDAQKQEDEDPTDVRSPKKANRTVANTHAWVTIIDSPPTGNSRHSSMVSSDTVSQMSGSMCSAKSDHDSISMSSEDAILEFDSSVVRYTMDGSGSSSVNSIIRLSATDREKHSNDYLEQHSYEPIDDQPVLHHNLSTHTSGQRPPVKLKANMGKEQISLITKVPTSDTNTEQPTLLNMATPARYDYENHTLNFQQGDGQASLPPRSLTTMHKHGQPVSPTFCSPPRQEVFFERTNFKRLDTPRTLLAKKLGKLQELSMIPTPVPDTITEQPVEHTSPSTVTQRYDYENYTLPFERQNEEIRSASLPPRSLPRTAVHTHVRVGSPPCMASTKSVASTPSKQEASIIERVLSNTATQRCDYENHSLTFEHQNEETSGVSFPPQLLTATHVRSPPPMTSTPPGQLQETGFTERKDSSRLKTPRTLLAMQSRDRETAQEHSDKKVPAPENPYSEQPKVEEPHVRRNYENHCLKFERPSTAAAGIPLPPRSMTAANERLLPSAVNNTPRQDKTAGVERTDFSRLATPSTLRRLTSLQSGKPSSSTPDYVDEDYINTSLLSMSGLPSPTMKSGSTIAVTPDYDYVDEDYINTVLISQSDHCSPNASTVAQTDIVDEVDYVNTTPPTTMKRGTRPPLFDGNDKEDDFVYDYPDLRNTRLLLSPKSHKVHRIKSVPLGSDRETLVPPRRTKRRAISDAASTQHLTTITQAALGTSDKLSDKNGHENSFGGSSMNVGSTDSMSQQDISVSTQDYVSGYVNTKLERPLPCRKVGESTSVNEGGDPVDSDEEFEYDYPNFERTIRFNFGAPHQKLQKKLATLPPRKGNNKGSSTTFGSALTSSKSGSSTSNMETPLPKWWLQLIEERERMRDNPDLYLHFAMGRPRSSQQPVIGLPPRQTLQEQQHQQHASVCKYRESLGIDTDEYIVMASAGYTVDDNYVNWETIYNAREYISSPHTRHATSKTLPPRKGVAKDAENIPRVHRRYSMDDMQVPYNVNVPPQEPVALPPRGVCRTILEESKPENDVVLKKRSSVVETPRTKPQVKPKPVGLVGKQQRDGSLSYSDDSKPSELNKPKPKPKPKLRPKPKIDHSTKHPLTRTVSSKEEIEEIKLTTKSEDRPLHRDSSLSLSHLPQPPVPTPRPSRLSDHSTPSELTLNVGK